MKVEQNGSLVRITLGGATFDLKPEDAADLSRRIAEVAPDAYEAGLPAGMNDYLRGIMSAAIEVRCTPSLWAHKHERVERTR